MCKNDQNSCRLHGGIYAVQKMIHHFDINGLMWKAVSIVHSVKTRSESERVTQITEEMVSPHSSNNRRQDTGMSSRKRQCTKPHQIN